MLLILCARASIVAASGLYRAVVAGASARCEASSMAWACMDSHGCVCKIATRGSSIRNFELAVQKFDSMVWGYVEVSVEHKWNAATAVCH